MSEEKKCGCGHHEEEKECSCGHSHEDSDCECGCNHDQEEEFNVVEFEDENGNIKEFPIIDDFSVDGVSYVLIKDLDEDSVFMLRVGEDGELVNPTEEEFNKVTEIYYGEEE